MKSILDFFLDLIKTYPFLFGILSYQTVLRLVNCFFVFFFWNFTCRCNTRIRKNRLGAWARWNSQSTPDYSISSTSNSFFSAIGIFQVFPQSVKNINKLFPFLLTFSIFNRNEMPCAKHKHYYLETFSSEKLGDTYTKSRNFCNFNGSLLGGLIFCKFSESIRTSVTNRECEQMSASTFTLYS